MNTGKTLFAQIMDFLPWSTFDPVRNLCRFVRSHCSASDGADRRRP
jgi:hypothetical protein